VIDGVNGRMGIRPCVRQVAVELMGKKTGA